jgi:hypothetical protein
MHLDKDPVNDSYGVTFFGPEVEVVRSAYVEESVYLERSGNAGSISKHDRHIMQGEHGESLNFNTEQPNQTMSVLRRFVERTDQEAIELANLPMPAHLNRHIVVRRGLGAAAAELLEEMEARLQVFTEDEADEETETRLTDAQIDSQVKEFRAQLEGES